MDSPYYLYAEFRSVHTTFYSQLCCGFGFIGSRTFEAEPDSENFKWTFSTLFEVSMHKNVVNIKAYFILIPFYILHFSKIKVHKTYFNQSLDMEILKRRYPDMVGAKNHTDPQKLFTVF
jgi:hypothetical protein